MCAISVFRRKRTVCCDIAVIALLLSSSYTLLTCTAFAGGYDGGFYLAVTDDGAGSVNAWDDDDYPVDVDLDTNSARVEVHDDDGPHIYEFNRRSGTNQYMAESGAVLDVYDCDNLRLTTGNGIGYITR